MKIFKYLAVGLLLVAGLNSCGSDYLNTQDREHLDPDAAGKAAGHNPNVFLNGIWSWLITFDTQKAGEKAAHDDFSYMSVLHATDMMGVDIAAGALHWFRFDYGFDNRMYNYRRTAVDWNTFYTVVAKANEIISLYPAGRELTAGEKALLGQAQAMRGMAYYYLIQLYQDPVTTAGTVNSEAKGVPLIYTAADGYSEEEMAKYKSRNTLKEVYARIEKDLTAAVSNLDGYTRPSKNYVDQHVANGLLARYYLLSQQWQKAADAANAARQGYVIMDNTGLHDGFMNIANKEWMWGFDQNTETQTTYASFFSHISNLSPGYSGMGYNTNLIDANLYNQISSTDYRKSLFNGPEGNDNQANAGAKMPYANLKFGWDGKWTMDYPYMRAAEMVLIEAEAYARLGQNDKAAQVLAVLMANRQPDWKKASVSVDDVLLQRRIELWGEGFSYFDLKRTGRGIDRTYQGTNHFTGYIFAVPAHDVKWTYQIPRREMQENKLIKAEDQNP
ncbi:RagB/SusD family nutrient uptake outer membrane protein [Hallella seregens]|uniref:RagB/SusD family nutrient uptake outer membrane protein n=1 Tax=Hallella seregens ATCC 51272 TaxID=1336250 RepID=A0ABV5ZPL4_9BACT|nr:RagB/SusD family nutrient uptake outer membrane protein [Hallella seregens]